MHDDIRYITILDDTLCMKETYTFAEKWGQRVKCIYLSFIIYIILYFKGHKLEDFFSIVLYNKLCSEKKQTDRYSNIQYGIPAVL